jgi:hypothetical protein
MIGHYLLTLTADAEHDALTSVMRPGSYVTPDGGRCLVGVCAGMSWRAPYHHASTREHFKYYGGCVLGHGFPVEYRYDDLCKRFGVERINAAIRNRILTNQARRALAGQRETVAA